ncbi:DUF2461 domain-containing protein [Calditrichota bacterium]
MSVISTAAFDFFADLMKNNNKAWFDKNRKRYDASVQKPMKALAASLTAPVTTILPDFSGKAKISRINNDIRFHKNKPPYKEHMWIAFKPEGDFVAEMFTGISENGWSAGVGLHGQKKDEINLWRENLLKHTDLWRAYTNSFNSVDKLQIHYGDPYKKPLYPDIPEDIYELVQARGAWMFTNTTRKFSANPESDVFNAICRMLPAYMFMTVSSTKLTTALKALGSDIPAPDKASAKIWKAVQ